MADTIKKVYLKKKINENVAIVYPKTSADNVEYNDTDTVKDKIDAINNPMTGATSSQNGVSGLVPAPSAGNQDKFLKGDGTWSEVKSITEINLTGAVTGSVTFDGTVVNINVDKVRTTLYSNTSGTTENITLAEDISSYKEIEILYGVNGIISSSKAYVNGSSTCICMSITCTDDSSIKFYTGKCSISSKALTRGTTADEKLLTINWATSGALNFDTTNGPELLIYKVLGHN